MSLEDSAQVVADQLRRQHFIEVFAHHDADGIAAGAILCHAMLRAGLRFRLRLRQEIGAADLKGDGAKLLCDLGSGIADLPEDTLVVDHHMPRFAGTFHANPRLAGIDGDRELSAAGTAYLVAQFLGDNRDLAGLVMPGIIGDGQELAGRNLAIFNDGVAGGVITPSRGLTLPGEDMAGRLSGAISPYLPGISGDETAAAALVSEATADGGLQLGTLLTFLILKEAANTPVQRLAAIYGDTMHLEREVIEDAHTLAAVLEACGKTGRGEIGAALCLRSSRDLSEALAITRKHHAAVIGAVRSAQPAAGALPLYEVSDAGLTSDVADIFAQAADVPVLVYGRNGGMYRISVRNPAAVTRDIGTMVRTIAEANGGRGGGHIRRAGAMVPAERIAAFVRGWQEAVAA